MSKITLLVDGNALMHRSYHAVKFNPTYEGQPVGMVYGFTSGLLYAVEHFQPKYCVVAFDTKEKTFRHEMDENYKAQRTSAPDDFYPQLPYIDEMLEIFGVNIQRKPGFEADDIVGTLAVQADKMELDTYIMSHDMDYSQLLNDRIKLLRSAGRVQDESIMDSAGVEAKLGIPPSKVVDYKAIVGDSSDNFKGIPGIGPKGAIELLNLFGDLETMLASSDQIPDKYKPKFEGQEEAVRHCQTLARIETAVPLEQTLQSIEAFEPQFGPLSEICEKWGFNSLKNRAQKLSSGNSSGENTEQQSSSSKSASEEQMSLF